MFTFFLKKLGPYFLNKKKNDLVQKHPQPMPFRPCAYLRYYIESDDDALVDTHVKILGCS